jgi:hypothetical protein
MGFKNNRYPVIVTNIVDLPSKNLKLSARASMRWDNKCLGIWYPSTTKGPDLIYIDIPRHKNKKQLTDTLVHELIHSRFKTTIHNSDFYRKIREIKSGKVF